MAFGIHDAELILCDRKALICGAAEPLGRLIIISGHTKTVFVQKAQSGLCFGIPLLGRLANPLACTQIIPWSTCLVIVAFAQQVLGLCPTPPSAIFQRKLSGKPSKNGSGSNQNNQYNQYEVSGMHERLLPASHERLCGIFMLNLIYLTHTHVYKSAPGCRQSAELPNVGQAISWNQPRTFTVSSSGQVVKLTTL